MSIENAPANFNTLSHAAACGDPAWWNAPTP